MGVPKILIFGHSGIGGALAKNLQGAGKSVHVVGRNEQALKSLSSEVKCTYTVCDVMQTNQIEKAVKEAIGDSGKLGGLAYCVGSIPLKPLKSVTPEEMLENFHLNTVGAAMAVKFSHEALAKSEGNVLLFSSIAARQGFANHTIIASAKGGIEGLTLTLAAELAPHIRVNAIAPALVESPLGQTVAKSETMRKSVAALHPIPRLGTPEEVAQLGAFLLDNQKSGWITGQIIGVDGGRSTLRVKG